MDHIAIFLYTTLEVARPLISYFREHFKSTDKLGLYVATAFDISLYRTQLTAFL